MNLLPATLAFAAQLVNSHSKKTADELFLKEIINRFWRGGQLHQRLSSLKLIFGGIEIEREVGRSAAAFEPLRSFCFVGYKAVCADTQKCSQTRFRRIEIAQIFLFKQLRKEILCEVFCVLVRFAPADAQVLVNRLPVSGCNFFERRGTLRRIGAARRQYRRQARCWKLPSWSADSCIFRHLKLSVARR